MRSVYRSGTVGPVKVEVKEISQHKPIELDLSDAINFASTLAKEKQRRI